ncbi:sensor histidine kinase [Aquimarina sp. 2201CG5-10]|uniref:sensor histidine kinase n=1 Tax=Aquimarina callyspongiae TaxID=3098150 RepID=UPI002AB3E51D|nr:histidine kinase [Aquimarina sp. 2201CG5-10]MDY8136161.1 histidine kinase [Aquimarina sp. 2201CG5-10]
MVTQLSKRTRLLIRIFLILLFVVGCINGYYKTLVEFDQWIAYAKTINRPIGEVNVFINTLFNNHFAGLFITVFYPVLVFFMEKKDLINPSIGWRKKEILLASFLLALVLFVSIDETYELYPIMFYIYLGVFILLIGFVWYYFFRNISIPKPLRILAFIKNNIKNIILGILLFACFILMLSHKEHPTYEYLFDLWSIIFILTIAYIVLSWILKEYKAIRKLKNEKAQAELLHLKSQVNPHFFFNTLNNLYGLIRKNPDDARELVLELSDMMRYTIYEGQKESVPIQEEVTYLKNFITIHQKRYHKHIDIQFKTEIENNNCRVMPLLFIILVENAFKHGVENLRKNAYIHMHLALKNNTIRFDIENNYDHTERSQMTGIGIKNLKKRLILMYPERHKLHIETTNTIYKATLEIQLV